MPQCSKSCFGWKSPFLEQLLARWPGNRNAIHRIMRAMAGKEITSEEPPTDPDRNPAGGFDYLATHPQKSRAAHIALCQVCGQAFDMRELDQVLHHGLGPHDPLPTNG
jgi:hypothetical protein